MLKFGAGMIVGLMLATAGVAWAQVYATVDTNGVLKGYAVYKKNRLICRDPWVQNDFRDQGSFINCP